MNNNIDFIVKKKLRNKYLLGIIFTLIVVAGFIYDVYGLPMTDHDAIVEGLSESLIRFHVVANSDSAGDQALKLLVKDEVVKEMEILLQSSTSIDESREIINNNIENIKGIAENVVANNGQDMAVEVSLKQETFPVKKYGDIVLPSGEYEALVINLGEAKGKNWWCILFPPLCFVDATHGVVNDEAKKGLQDVLTEEEYKEIILNEDCEVDITVKFKIVEWFKEKEENSLTYKTFAKIFE
jgi:stage II sporulation protein R